MRFFSPDSGGGSGAAGSASGASAGAEEIDLKVFDSLPWDDLDADTAASLKKLQTSAVATLQSKKLLEAKFKEADGLSRKFQSEADKLKKQAEADANTNKPKDPYLEAVSEELAAAGYQADDVAKLGPVFASMFKRTGAMQKAEIGRDLGPMAASVLASQATDAFTIAQQHDGMGMLQIPEVAQNVWDFVKERVDKGETTTPEMVLNLAKMAWVDHQAASGGKPELPARLSATPPNMNTGGFSFPGSAGLSSIANPPRDANAARTALDPETKAALVTSFRSLLSGMPASLRPTELKESLNSTRRHR